MPNLARRRFPRATPERLRISSILAWADAFHKRSGRWPHLLSGSIPESSRSTWRQVDRALRDGFRGMQRGSSLARLLAEHRGVRNRQGLPDLTVRQILTWADTFQKRTGRWPRERGDGAIFNAPGETWRNVGAALREGGRGFPGGSSLQRLLEAHRGFRNRGNLPHLTIRQILRWADEHHARTGRHPSATLRAAIPNSGGETWRGVDNAMQRSSRGLRGPTSLAKLLAKHRGYRNIMNLPRLTVREILAWADSHHARHKRWPTVMSGSIPNTQERWARVNDALRFGFRGLPSGLSLSRLLIRHRSRRGYRPCAKK